MNETLQKNAMNTGTDEIHDASNTDGKLALKEGYCYLLEEKQPLKAYDYFRNAINSGARCLCVTRDPPHKLKGKYSLPENNCIWLSNIPSDQTIQPKNLENVLVSIDEFISKDEGSLVLIDCIEYLITNNNFNAIIKLLQSIKDKVALQKATLLISTDPGTLDSQNINHLRDEMDEVL